MRPSSICGLLITANALAQTPTPPPSADALTHAWALQLTAADSRTPPDEQKYTYLIHHHNVTSIQGKVTDDHTYTSEQIFIGGLPYIRRLDYDGKPLKGKDLKRETALYEKAVRDRTGLDQNRNTPTNARVFHTKFVPGEYLDAEFSHKIVGNQTLDGHALLVLELIQLDPQAPPERQRRIRFSIDPQTCDVIQFWVEYLAPSNGFARGTIIDNRKTYVDGILLPQSFKLETKLGEDPDGKMNPHIVSTDTFTDYKRFTASATIVPVNPN